jgi:hypothetical protein
MMSAQTKWRKLDGASRMPKIYAIVALNRYYVASEPPESGSIDWVSFYDEFRVDLNEYNKTRSAYLEELAGEVESYWRVVRNS